MTDVMPQRPPRATGCANAPADKPADKPAGSPAQVPAAAALDARERTEIIERLRDNVAGGPDDGATARQHARGKLTARERIGLLLDPDSFVEIEAFRRHRSRNFGLDARRPFTDGVVTGWGTVDGRTVYVFAHDFRIFGGSLGEAHAEKIHKLLDLARKSGSPVVSLNDGAGARVQEGVIALAGYGGIFQRIVDRSGVIPQISVMLGPCAGGAAYAPALSDVVFMVRESAQVFVTGPDVVEQVSGEKVSHEDLGGAAVHSEDSGVATFVHDDEKSCLGDVRLLLSLLPSNSHELPPTVPSADPEERLCTDLVDHVSADGTTPYDMRTVVTTILDQDADFVEFHELWATNVVCGLGRLAGRVVGIVASQPTVLAGTLDIHASEKAARFVQYCDAFNVPLLTFVDVPGFLPGTAQERGGIIRHGAKLLYAYCAATVPRIQVILRKAYGGSYIVMDSRSIGADLSFAWPTNEIAVMGPEGAASVIFRREIADSDEPGVRRQELIDIYRRELVHPLHAAENGLVDDVIAPADTRRVLARSLTALADKCVGLPDRKHGNPPS